MYMHIVVFPQAGLQNVNSTFPMLVGGFNPSEKYARQIGSFPQIGMTNQKNISNHHPAMILKKFRGFEVFGEAFCFKPPPRMSRETQKFPPFWLKSQVSTPEKRPFTRPKVQDPQLRNATPNWQGQCLPWKLYGSRTWKTFEKLAKMIKFWLHHSNIFKTMYTPVI